MKFINFITIPNEVVEDRVTLTLSLFFNSVIHILFVSNHATRQSLKIY